MNKYIISCESTCDLSVEHLSARDIKYVMFHFAIDGKEYFDDFGQSIPFDKFYEMVGSGIETRTSQVNVSEYEAHFKKYLEEGYDIVHVTLSSGLSGTINSARNAVAIVADQYPDRKIYVVDSLAASSGYGLLLDKAADLRDSGKTAEEVVDWLENNKLKLHHWFFSTDLSAYVRGGRISKSAAFFGGALQICPLLNMNSEGKLIPREKIRTKKRVIREIVDRMHQFAQNGDDYNDKCFISQANSIEDAEIVADEVKAEFPKLNGQVEINWIGTTIGSHTGPGTVALFFWGNERGE